MASVPVIHESFEQFLEAGLRERIVAIYNGGKR